MFKYILFNHATGETGRIEVMTIHEAEEANVNRVNAGDTFLWELYDLA